jgi:sulfide:quinone oxidoreductase
MMDVTPTGLWRGARPACGCVAARALTYDGKGICYIEFGHDRVARVEVTFRSGERPDGQFDEPSGLLQADKAEFGTSRIRRWFGRDWTSY